jgi:hypothetical protein
MVVLVRRTYLSQRDLQAHIDHRHAMTDKQLSTAAVAASIEQQPQQQSIMQLQQSSINNSHLRKVPY